MVTEAGGMWPWAKGLQQPPEASRGRALPLILWSKQAHAGYWTVRVHVCGFKLPAWGPFVAAAPGDSYTGGPYGWWLLTLEGTTHSPVPLQTCKCALRPWWGIGSALLSSVGSANTPWGWGLLSGAGLAGQGVILPFLPPPPSLTTVRACSGVSGVQFLAVL